MIEVMVALVLIAVGVLALMRLMPTSTHVQNVNRMQETAVQFVDEEFEAMVDKQFAKEVVEKVLQTQHAAFE